MVILFRLPYELYYFWEEVLANESQVLMSHWKYGKKGLGLGKGRRFHGIPTLRGDCID
jgi:hypothetical protein